MELTGYAKLNPSINTPLNLLRKCVLHTSTTEYNLEPFLNDEGIALTSEDIEIIAGCRHAWATNIIAIRQLKDPVTSGRGMWHEIFEI